MILKIKSIQINSIVNKHIIMEELKTILGTEIPISTRGILYLCSYNPAKKKITVINELLTDSQFEAVEYYANIQNPESQLVTGRDFNSLILNLHKLHHNMKDKQWLTQLAECM